jgi:3-deoxy-D-manno-octulosonic-acid transferase
LAGQKRSMKFLYNLAINIFTVLVILAAPFNSKAALWVKGRKDWRKNFPVKKMQGDKTLWIHCASLGEFEQGRPVIESIKKQVPGIKILLTFFSPSGYEIRKNYSEADYVCYLPADTPSNAAEFIRLADPSFVIIVKYEFWNNYISELHRKNIPLYLISGIFRPEQHFFKWYGSFFREILRKFKTIFVQDQASAELLAKAGIMNVIVAGDTRFDRVAMIAGNARDIPVLENFRNNEKLLLAGSSWKPDEEIIAEYINKHPGAMKWVFAPHEIEKENIERLEGLFRVKCVRFSQYDESMADARVLIIDNIGMLSSAYRYAYIAIIGGGFGKGIHNILEAACWGIPVIFGPNHGKFREAVELIKEKGAMTFDSFENFSEILDKWLNDESSYLKSASSASSYVSRNTGATPIILEKIVHRS